MTTPINSNLKTLEAFASLLAARGVIDECAVYDSENYDGGNMMNRVGKVFAALTEPSNEPRTAIENLSEAHAQFLREIEARLLDIESKMTLLLPRLS